MVDIRSSAGSMEDNPRSGRCKSGCLQSIALAIGVEMDCGGGREEKSMLIRLLIDVLAFLK